jgi:peptidyl-prolyl cis-trans isomerase D
MLTTLRSKTGGWIAKIFIGLLAASFAVWGIEDMLRGRVSDELARVGERVISTTEYSEQFNQQLRVYSQRLNETVTPDRARELGLDRQILGDLMRDAALDSQATELGIRMPAKAVAQSIADTPRFQSADGSFNANAFRQLLRANGLSEQQFFAAEAQNMTRQVISQPLTALAVVPDTLVELIWKHRSEQRDAKWFEITVPADAAKEPSDADLKKYYDENPVAFAQPELRTFAVVALTPEAIASRIEVSEDDLKRQYEADKSKYTTEETRSVLQIPFPNEAEAQAALDKIKAGTSFENVARERGLTEADMSLGTVAKSAIPDTAIADAAFALEDGAVSGVVKGRLSTVLLKAKIEQQGATRTLEEVKDQVTKDAQARLARDRLLDLHDKFEDARAGGASMDEAAGEIGLPVQTVGPVAQNGNDANEEPVSVPGHPSALNTAFESEVGLEISPLTDGDNGFTWVETRDVTPARTPPFNEIKAKVAASWKAREAAKATRAKAEELVKKLESGTPIEELAAAENAEVQSAQGLKRTEASVSFTPSDISALFSVKPDGKTFSMSQLGTSAKIIASTPVLGTSFDPASDEAKAIREVLQSNLSNDLYAEYVTALQEDIGVTIDDAAWSKLRGGQ